MRSMFITFVDTLTPWHLRILAFFQSPAEWGARNQLSYPNWSMGGAATVLEHTFPALNGRRDLYDQIVKDLFARGLMTTDSLHTTVTRQSMFASRTTPMGGRFLEFISSPLETKS